MSGLTLGSLKTRIYRGIAARRDHWGITLAANAARSFLGAYGNNDYSHTSNGEQRVLSSLPPNLVVTAFDVGANEGPWTAMLLDAQPSAQVHCFEIVPSTAAALARRFEGRPSVTINAVGLGSKRRHRERVSGSEPLLHEHHCGPTRTSRTDDAHGADRRR